MALLSTRHAVTLAAGLAVGLLAGCGEKPQTAVRKSDTAAYQGSAGTHTTGDWKAGDAKAWEAQIKQRAQYGQNEYSRSAP
jgi:hypothetical protein